MASYSGTAFELASDGSGETNLVALISFDHQNAAWPEASLIVDAFGDLSGTSLRGGGPMAAMPKPA